MAHGRAATSDHTTTTTVCCRETLLGKSGAYCNPLIAIDEMNDNLAVSPTPATRVSSCDEGEIRLPTELLGRIFEYVRAHYAKTKRPVRFLVVSHVCIYWRAVALGWSRLWAMLTPDVAERGLLDVYVERSGSMCLSLDIGTLNPSIYTRTLMAEHHRIESLTCELHQGIIPLLDKPMSRLRRLELRGQRDMFSAMETRLLHGLLCSAPDMQDLNLICISPKSFPWMAPFASMRRLNLHGVGSAPPLPYTFYDVVSGLRAMQSLENLSLRVDMPPHDCQTAYEPIRLPRLRSLRLSGHDDPLVMLWSLVTCHPHCSIALEVESDAIDIARMDMGLFHLGINRFSMDSSLTDSELYIERCFATELIFVIKCGDKKPFNSRRLDLSFRWRSEAQNAERLAELLMAAAHIESCKRITIYSSNWPDTPFPLPSLIAELARRATALETLVLRFFTETPTTSTLSILCGQDMDAIPMPRLKRLELWCMSIGKTALMDALGKRREAGLRIEELYIPRCMVHDGGSLCELEGVKRQLIHAQAVGTVHYWNHF